jgi:hypothetical protein
MIRWIVGSSLRFRFIVVALGLGLVYFGTQRGAVANDVEIGCGGISGGEVIGSGCQVNALRREFVGDGLPAVDLAHSDLA